MSQPLGLVAFPGHTHPRDGQPTRQDEASAQEAGGRICDWNMFPFFWPLSRKSFGRPAQGGVEMLSTCPFASASARC